jgi:hypothetical protein
MVSSPMVWAVGWAAERPSHTPGRTGPGATFLDGYGRSRYGASGRAQVSAGRGWVVGFGPTELWTDEGLAAERVRTTGWGAASPNRSVPPSRGSVERVLVDRVR